LNLGKTSLQNKQKTTRHTEDDTESVSRQKQNSDDKQVRNASHRRREDDEKRWKAGQNSSKSRT